MDKYFQTIIEALYAIVNTDEFAAKASIGMLIDMVSARYGDDPVELAEEVAEVVKQFHESMGRFEEVAK